METRPLDRLTQLEKRMLRTKENAVGYPERLPEILVLEGYRCWTLGLAMRSTDPWTDAQILYRGVLGDDQAEQAIISLVGFVKTLGICATCPLRMCRPGSRVISRDETLVMGTIAGIQNADKMAVDYCLGKLCCRDVCDEVALSAGLFALNLRAMKQTLLPVTVESIIEIVDGPPSRARGDGGQPTLH